MVQYGGVLSPLWWLLWQFPYCQCKEILKIMPVSFYQYIVVFCLLVQLLFYTPCAFVATLLSCTVSVLNSMCLCSILLFMLIYLLCASPWAIHVAPELRGRALYRNVCTQVLIKCGMRQDLANGILGFTAHPHASAKWPKWSYATRL